MKIGLTIGRTVNIGNYESVRVEVSADQDCGESAQERAEGFEDLHSDLTAALQRVISEEKDD